jgi:hypothetical protein
VAYVLNLTIYLYQTNILEMSASRAYIWMSGQIDLAASSLGISSHEIPTREKNLDTYSVLSRDRAGDKLSSRSMIFFELRYKLSAQRFRHFVSRNDFWTARLMQRP